MNIQDLVSVIIARQREAEADNAAEVKAAETAIEAMPAVGRVKQRGCLCNTE